MGNFFNLTFVDNSTVNTITSNAYKSLTKEVKLLRKDVRKFTKQKRAEKHEEYAADQPDRGGDVQNDIDITVTQEAVTSEVHHETDVALELQQIQSHNQVFDMEVKVICGLCQIDHSPGPCPKSPASTDAEGG